MGFPSQAGYERLVYTLPQDYPDIVSSSLRLHTASRGTTVVWGNIRFRNGLELRVSEIVDFVAGRISDYGYTVFRGEERIRWYDPQPHSENPGFSKYLSPSLPRTARYEAQPSPRAGHHFSVSQSPHVDCGLPGVGRESESARRRSVNSHSLFALQPQLVDQVGPVFERDAGHGAELGPPAALFSRCKPYFSGTGPIGAVGSLILAVHALS
jgi:hypothetical protein